MNIERLTSLFVMIQITQESRRTDHDNAGNTIKKGNYAMWNYRLANKKGEVIKSEWPGFLRTEDMINDIAKKIES